MKDRIMFLVIGILIGAIIATGVFMVINKNRGSVRGGGARNFQGGNFNPVDINGATRIIQEDGSEKLEFPDGRVIVRQENPDGQGSSLKMPNVE